MGISVIMSSRLSPYKGAASNRELKFFRAVGSFLKQQWVGDSELIIVSDGCKITNDLYKHNFANFDNIRLVKLEKEPVEFSGKPRNVGIEKAIYSQICYLDTDDTFGGHHLSAINFEFDSNLDWVYFDDFVMTMQGPAVRKVTLEKNVAGTSCIAHKKGLGVKWPDGWGHDWKFIKQLMAKHPKYKKINKPEYIVHHIDGVIDA